MRKALNTQCICTKFRCQIIFHQMLKDPNRKPTVCPLPLSCPSVISLSILPISTVTILMGICEGNYYYNHEFKKFQIPHTEDKITASCPT